MPILGRALMGAGLALLLITDVLRPPAAISGVVAGSTFVAHGQPPPEMRPIAPPAGYSNTTAAPAVYADATAEPTVYPNTSAAPAVYPGATTAPTVYPDATAAPTVYPEATAAPSVYPDAKAAPTVYPNATAAPTVYPNRGADLPVPGAQPAPPASGTATFPTAPHRGVPSPSPSPTAADRFHLHRPGTDVDGDVLSGSMASQVYVLKGNVTLHSDPKIDREIAAASESDDPLTITADEIDADRFGLSYVAKGHVHFVQGTRSGFADLGNLDERSHSLDLIGNVEVLDGNRRTKAAKMHYDTVDKSFIGSGNVRIYEPLPTPNPNVSATPPPKRKRRLPL